MFHLQFADDTILFCEAMNPYINNIRTLLHCFEKIIGLKVNLDESTVAGLNLNEDEPSFYAQALRCNKEN